MAAIEELFWEFEMSYDIDKEIDASISLTHTTVSGNTMSLEEDEAMCEEVVGETSSIHTEYVSSCMEDDEIDDITSCSSMDSDFDDDIISIQSDVDDDEMDDNIIIWSTRSPRRVRFAHNETTEHLIMSRSEYTQEEIEKSWYSQSQQKVLNKANNKTVRRLEAGLKEKRSAPYRGLEQFSIDGYYHMLEAQHAYVDTVMDEMQRQWDERDIDEMLDWEAIANLTKEITEQSAQEAFVTALFDEDEARVAYEAVKVKDLMVQQQQKPSSPPKKSKNKRDKMTRLESFVLTAEEKLPLSPSVKTKKKNKAMKGLKPRSWMKSLLKKR